jgi:hypothetical protein
MVDMRGSRLLDFHRAAEAAAYPAPLIISSLCLGLVVASVAVLGVTRAGWALALALPSLIVALAALAPGQPTARQAGQDLKAA